ncbi:PH domain-containing protein [Paenibacillus azoreducens]|uniref:PH domain-containing protein n=1 Tax=Paenibacillus azoreducens TaxID=116718 RepID=UPI0039F50274
MMNKRQGVRLHKLFILFPLVHLLKAFLPISVLLTIRVVTGGKSMSPATVPWFIGTIAAIFLFLLFYGWLQWKRFVYVLEDDKIVIRRGVIFRGEQTIYAARIHSLNIEQPFAQRLFGLTLIKFDMPGKADHDGGKLLAVSSAEAARLQQWLRERTASDTVDNPVHATTEMSPNRVNTAESMQIGPGQDPEQELLDLKLPVVEADTDKNAAPAWNLTPQNPKPIGPASSAPAFAEERTTLLALSPGKLFIAALTSFNLTLAVAFLFGAYSLANDFLPGKLSARAFMEAGSWLYGGWFTLVPLAIILAWILSGILFTIKYAGFKVERVGKQIAVTSGLFDRKQMFFSPKRVQAVSVKEGLLRQPFGYAEIKLHVLTSESEKNLILHPLIPVRQVGELLEQIVPQFKADPVERRSPRRGLWMVLQIDLALTAILCAACIAYFKEHGLWSLLLFPLSIFWTVVSYKDTGFTLRDKQLTMRSRIISRSTQYARRPQIVSLKVRSTRRQRKRNLRSFKVYLITSQYNQSLSHLEQKDVEEIWNWFRSSGRAKPRQQNTIRHAGTPIATEKSAESE